MNSVISNNKILDMFSINEGLRQRGRLSLLFNVFMHEIIKKHAHKVKKLYVGYRKSEQTGISMCSQLDREKIYKNEIDYITQ